jgi:hypothetical protein
MDAQQASSSKRAVPLHRMFWEWICHVAPLLAPFLVAVIFVACYCGPNIFRGFACIVDSRLTLASGPKTRLELGNDGRRTFYPYELGEQISRVIQ